MFLFSSSEIFVNTISRSENASFDPTLIRAADLLKKNNKKKKKKKKKKQQKKRLCVCRSNVGLLVLWAIFKQSKDIIFFSLWSSQNTDFVKIYDEL